VVAGERDSRSAFQSTVELMARPATATLDMCCMTIGRKYNNAYMYHLQTPSRGRLEIFCTDVLAAQEDVSRRRAPLAPHLRFQIVLTSSHLLGACYHLFAHVFTHARPSLYPPNVRPRAKYRIRSLSALKFVYVLLCLKIGLKYTGCISSSRGEAILVGILISTNVSSIDTSVENTSRGEHLSVQSLVLTWERQMSLGHG
jgi:hypothetical protein